MIFFLSIFRKFDLFCWKKDNCYKGVKNIAWVQNCPDVTFWESLRYSLLGVLVSWVLKCLECRITLCCKILMRQCPTQWPQGRYRTVKATKDMKIDNVYNFGQIWEKMWDKYGLVWVRGGCQLVCTHQQSTLLSPLLLASRPLNGHIHIRHVCSCTYWKIVTHTEQM